MALSGYIFAVLTVATVHAVNQYQNQYGNFQNNHGFRQPLFPTIPIPNMQPLVFPTFPAFPTFSPQDVINRNVGPGENYNGVAISSSSFSQMGPDGKVIRNGGTKIITNRNGVVEEYDYPVSADSKTNIRSPSLPLPVMIPQLKPLKLPALPFPIIKPPPLPILQIPQLKTFISIPPVNIPLPRVPSVDPTIIRSYKPGQDEQFTGRSIVSYRHSSNINGDKTSGGVDTIISNDNGVVNKKTYKYGDLNDKNEY
ncbi:unnamed protein product [Leptosia nina]|uniref:Seroin transcript 1A n=1 Tax=Leptosia nina TaxID=320188 RepID=A0AAV1J5X1_9NEOP